MSESLPEEKSRFRGLITISIMLATLLYSIDWTIVVVALPYMKGIFSATEDQVAWVITCYIVASAIALPTAGWASRRFGRKRMMLISIAGFTFASIACGAADSLSVEVIARVFQGFWGIYSASFKYHYVDNFDAKDHGKALSIWSIGAFLALFSGQYWRISTEYLSWRYMFYINIPIGLLAFLGILFFLRESKRDYRAKLDWLGFLSLQGVSALQIMFDRGHRLDWFIQVK